MALTFRIIADCPHRPPEDTNAESHHHQDTPTHTLYQREIPMITTVWTLTWPAPLTDTRMPVTLTDTLAHLLLIVATLLTQLTTVPENQGHPSRDEDKRPCSRLTYFRSFERPTSVE